MKTEQVTYDKFLNVVQRMQENDEKLTVRSVLARTGGSFGKISEFLKRFEQERAYLNLVKQSDLSESLRQAMLGEIGKAVAEAKVVLETQMTQLTAHLEEANEQLNAQEQIISSLREETEALKEKMMLSQQNIHDLESTNQDLQKRLDDTQKEKMLAITDAAKSKLQLERADKDLLESKDQCKALQSKLDEIVREKYEAEKRAAVAEARFEQTQAKK